MLVRTLLFVAGVVGFAIAVVPRGADDVARSAQAEDDPKAAILTADSSTLSTVGDGWYSDDHTLTRAVDGHFYANARIEGADVRLMVDTGASIVALTAEDADAAGVDWDPSLVRTIGRGASGDVLGVPAKLGSVEIGGFHREGIDAVVVPDGLDVSLLGQSYLSRIGSVKIADDKLVMSED